MNTNLSFKLTLPEFCLVSPLLKKKATIIKKKRNEIEYPVLCQVYFRHGMLAIIPVIKLPFYPLHLSQVNIIYFIGARPPTTRPAADLGPRDAVLGDGRDLTTRGPR